MTKRLFGSSQNHGVRMTQNQGPPRIDQVKVAIAILVPHPLTLSTLNEDRIAANASECARRTIDPPGDYLHCLLEKRLALFDFG